MCLARFTMWCFDACLVCGCRKCTADDSVLAVQQLAACELDAVIGGGCDSTLPSLQGLAAFYGIPAIALEARSAL